MIGEWSREIVVLNEWDMKLLRMKRYLYPSKGKMFHPRLVRDEA